MMKISQSQSEKLICYCKKWFELECRWLSHCRTNKTVVHNLKVAQKRKGDTQLLTVPLRLKLIFIIYFLRNPCYVSAGISSRKLGFWIIALLIMCSVVWRNPRSRTCCTWWRDMVWSLALRVSPESWSRLKKRMKNRHVIWFQHSWLRAQETISRSCPRITSALCISLFPVGLSLRACSISSSAKLSARAGNLDALNDHCSTSIWPNSVLKRLLTTLSS